MWIVLLVAALPILAGLVTLKLRFGSADSDQRSAAGRALRRRPRRFRRGIP